MQFQLDHLAAVFIGMTIFLTVVTLDQDNREGLVETTAFYAMIQQQEDFAQTVTRDMQSVESLYTTAEDETDNTFRFRAHIGNDATLYDITYQREFARQRGGVSFYRIKRLVDGIETGGSADIITDWKIEGQDAIGDLVGLPAAAVQIFVRFEAASLLAETETIEGTRWQASFFPPLLQ